MTNDDCVWTVVGFNKFRCVGGLARQMHSIEKEKSLWDRTDLSHKKNTKKTDFWEQEILHPEIFFGA